MSIRETYRRNARCPFYLSAYHSGIKCEGVIEGTYTRTVFKSDKKLQKHFECFCNSEKKCLNCPIYKAKDKPE